MQASAVAKALALGRQSPAAVVRFRKRRALLLLAAPVSFVASACRLAPTSISHLSSLYQMFLLPRTCSSLFWVLALVCGAASFSVLETSSVSELSRRVPRLLRIDRAVFPR